MSEPVFLRNKQGLTLDEVAALAGAAAPAAALQARRIVGVAPLDRASPADISFLDSKRFGGDAARTHAGVCLTTAALAGELPARTVALVVASPYRAFVQVARALFPHALRPSSFVLPGTTAGAHIDPSARLESGVTVEPGAVVGPLTEIGSGTVIGATAVIGAEVKVGRDCSISAGATIANALIGDRVIIHPGVRIGQDGFGYVMGAGGHLKVPQVGRVIIQDDVEIGAGTAIDRGAIRDTVIGEGTKIDNLVQIGHNANVGRHCVIVAQAAIAGSVTMEDFAVLGGCSAINNQVTVGEGAQIAAASNVNGNVPPGARWGGTPARPLKEWFRTIRAIDRLARTKADAASPQED